MAHKFRGAKPCSTGLCCFGSGVRLYFMAQAHGRVSEPLASWVREWWERGKWPGPPTPPKGITPLSSSSHRLHLLSISHLSFLPPWGIGLSYTELGGNLTKPCYLILDLLSYCVGLSSLASTGAPSQHQGSLCKGFAHKALHMVEPVTSLCCLYRTVILNLWVASLLGVSNDPFTGVA